MREGETPRQGRAPGKRTRTEEKQKDEREAANESVRLLSLGQRTGRKKERNKP